MLTRGRCSSSLLTEYQREWFPVVAAVETDERDEFSRAQLRHIGEDVVDVDVDERRAALVVDAAVTTVRREGCAVLRSKVPTNARGAAIIVKNGVFEMLRK